MPLRDGTETLLESLEESFLARCGFIVGENPGFVVLDGHGVEGSWTCSPFVRRPGKRSAKRGPSSVKDRELDSQQQLLPVLICPEPDPASYRVGPSDIGNRMPFVPRQMHFRHCGTPFFRVPVNLRWWSFYAGPDDRPEDFSDKRPSQL